MPRSSVPGTPVKSEERRKHLFVKGDPRINRDGAKKGARRKITERKAQIIAQTGMMPVDFFSMVLRDQLYSDYDMKERVADGMTIKVFTPAKGAKKIPVTLNQRLQAANSLAPYVHKRMPIAIEGTDKPLTVLDASRLAQLSPAELDAFIATLERLGIGGQFTGPGTTPPQAGRL